MKSNAESNTSSSAAPKEKELRYTKCARILICKHLDDNGTTEVVKTYVTGFIDLMSKKVHHFVNESYPSSFENFIFSIEWDSNAV